MIHFSDPLAEDPGDSLRKLSSFKNHLQHNFASNYIPVQHIAVDEYLSLFDIYTFANAFQVNENVMEQMERKQICLLMEVYHLYWSNNTVSHTQHKFFKTF